VAHSEYEKLIDDLGVIRTAIEKSSGIFRFLRLSRAMGLVGLWSGLGIVVLSLAMYAIDIRYGGLVTAPALVRGLLYGLVGLFVLAVGIGKIMLVMAQAKKSYRDITVLRLINEVYTPQTLPILIPSAVALGGVFLFLVSRGLGVYVAPVMSILFGLVFLAFHNIFYLRSMLYSAAWMICAGVVLLFLAESAHVALGVAVTFGLGFMALYMGDRIGDKV
jgi:hypothetical protein